MGVALAPASVLGTLPEAGRLMAHPLPESHRSLTTFYVRRRGLVSPPADAMAGLLDEAQDAAPAGPELPGG